VTERDLAEDAWATLCEIDYRPGRSQAFVLALFRARAAARELTHAIDVEGRRL
jgi:hypothetical protein